MEWWLIFLAGAIVLARLSRTRTDAVLAEVQRQSGAWRLPLSPAAHADAVVRTRRIARGDAVGAAVGFIIGIAVTALRSGAGDYPYAAMVGFLLGMIYGAAFAAASTLPRRRGTDRVAHARAVTLADLQPRWLTASVVAAPAAALAVVTATIVRDGAWPAWGGAGTDALVLAGASVLSLVGFWGVCRRALAAPRDARTDLELAWQDGYVAQAVTVAATVPLVTGLTAALLPVFPPPSFGLPLVLVVGAVGAGALWARPQRTFRLRLWDDREFDLEPADQVEPTPVAPRAGRS